MKTGEFIKNRLEELSIKNSKVVSDVFGYKNINKGMRILLGIYNDNDSLESKYIGPMCELLQVPENELIDAMIETEKYHQEQEEKVKAQEREAFIPHLFSIHENRIPTPIFAGSFTHSKRFRYFEKEFNQLPEEVILDRVKKTIDEHFTLNHGGLAAFGHILYYVYVPDYDAPKSAFRVFNTEGNEIEQTQDMRLTAGQNLGLYIRNRNNRIDHLFQIKEDLNAG